MTRYYYFYIMVSISGTIYAGVTNDLVRRVYEHKNKLVEGFTQRYNITRLVYFEEYTDVRDATAREKQVKGWVRVKKNELVQSVNPGWEDLSDGWYD